MPDLPAPDPPGTGPPVPWPLADPPVVPDLGRPRRVHLVAVGGAGMSAIATVLAAAGHTVTGSDLADGPALEPLRSAGVAVTVGHDAANVGAAELVGASTAVAPDNPELVEARRLGLPVLRRRALLEGLARRQPFVSVAGTHGKTTTSSMLAVALRGAGADPSFIVGAPVPALGGAASLGADGFTVLEADESDGSFLAGPRVGALVTNLEPDHLEAWGGWPALREGFRTFLERTEGPRLVCADDEGAVGIGEGRWPTYGTAPDATHRLLSWASEGDRSVLVVRTASGREVSFGLRMPGLHNARNATAAVAMSEMLGYDAAAAAAGLESHTGLYRRFERRGSAAGVEVVDDYAHLPTEVSAALEAGASLRPTRLVVVFQPHRYSRTEALGAAFGPCFAAADVVVVTDVFPAGEAPRAGVDGRLVLDAVRDAGGVEPLWAPGLDEAVGQLVAVLRPGDLLMTVGAGDVREVGDRVLAGLGGGGHRDHGTVGPA